jgi:hypothetical protein
MLHITCDLCGKQLRTGEERYVVKIEVFARHDPAKLSEEDLEEDHMEAISQLLRDMDEQQAENGVEPTRHHLRYDLCPECRQRYLRDPLNKELNKEAAQKFDFSEN